MSLNKADLQLLKQESDLINLLYHRNHNQHRGARWFRYFRMLRSTLLRYLDTTARNKNRQLQLRDRAIGLCEHCQREFRLLAEEGSFSVLALALIAISSRIWVILGGPDHIVTSATQPPVINASPAKPKQRKLADDFEDLGEVVPGISSILEASASTAPASSPRTSTKRPSNDIDAIFEGFV